MINAIRWLRSPNTVATSTEIRRSTSLERALLEATDSRSRGLRVTNGAGRTEGRRLGPVAEAGLGVSRLRNRFECDAETARSQHVDVRVQRCRPPPRPIVELSNGRAHASSAAVPGAKTGRAARGTCHFRIC